jgi:DNA-binding MarR family transcriptional regulator
VERTAHPAAPQIHTTALVYQAYLRLVEVSNAAARSVDSRLRPAHSTVFFHMEMGGIRLKRLAEKAMMTPQAMGELVDDLERMGFLRRVPDPTDRRAKLIVFTERGSAALETGFAAITDLERRLTQLLGAQRLAELHGTLQLIIDAG